MFTLTRIPDCRNPRRAGASKRPLLGQILEGRLRSHPMNVSEPGPVQKWTASTRQEGYLFGLRPNSRMGVSSCQTLPPWGSRKGQGQSSSQRPSGAVCVPGSTT